jgi:hypothetical protein
MQAGIPTYSIEDERAVPVRLRGEQDSHVRVGGKALKNPAMDEDPAPRFIWHFVYWSAHRPTGQEATSGI